jgi:hypothetical protein
MFGHTHKTRSKRNNNRKRLLETKEDSEVYLRVIKALGHCSFQCVNVNTGKEVTATLAGRLIHGPMKQFVREGDVTVAIDYSSPTEDKFMIHMVYTPDEVKKLNEMHELDNINVNNNISNAAVAFEKDAVAAAATDDTEFNFDEI